MVQMELVSNVKTIKNSAFEGCTNLTRVIIPQTASTVAANAFRRCTALESLQVTDGNPIYYTRDNCLIETATKTLLVGCKNSVIIFLGAFPQSLFATKSILSFKV